MKEDCQLSPLYGTHSLFLTRQFPALFKMDNIPKPASICLSFSLVLPLPTPDNCNIYFFLSNILAFSSILIRNNLTDGVFDQSKIKYIFLIFMISLVTFFKPANITKTGPDFSHMQAQE